MFIKFTDQIFKLCFNSTTLAIVTNENYWGCTHVTTTNKDKLILTKNLVLNYFHYKNIKVKSNIFLFFFKLFYKL